MPKHDDVTPGARRAPRLPLYLSRLACLIAGGVLACAAHAGTTIVTDNVISQINTSQTSVPVTFGQIFKDGDVPAGETVVATLGGQAVQLQVDAKATNPDGSLRHAVLTALIPTLAANATQPLAISSASPSATGSAVTLAQLLATGYDAKASLNIGGTAYTADAKTLLQAAQTAGSCAPWGTACNLWLSGPLVSEWVVNGPVKTASGSANPNLEVYFAVRAYSGSSPGTIAYVHTDIIVENSWAYTPAAMLQYSATLTSGSASYASPALTQYNSTRWHQVLWWNGAEPQVYLQQDTQYLQDSLAVSRYMVLQPTQPFLASVRQSCAPLDYCDQTQTMGNTGAQPSIGPLPRWTSVYILDPDVRAYNWMLANTDALGAYGIHFRDNATGFPISIQRHPDVTEIDWPYAYGVSRQSNAKGQQYNADLLQTACSVKPGNNNCTGYGTGNPDIWDNAHQPAESYVPYMVTGSWYYMSELAFGASHNEVWSNEAYRGYSQGLIDHSHQQIRGKAWVLREMVDAAWLLPDDYPLKAEFNADVNNALADFNASYTNNANASPLSVLNSGVVYPINGGTNNGTAPWQHNFLTWSAGHAAELGFADAAGFRNWLAKFEISLMTDWQANSAQGYCWLEASAYAIQVEDASGNWLPNFTAVYAANFPTLESLACNSPAMVAAMGALEGQTWQAGEMHGYPYSATGYPANFQIGLTAAADSGLPNVQTAWTIFQGRSVQPSGTTAYNDYPNFAVLPRSAPYTPIISLYASPNPVASGTTTTLYWNASGATSCSASWTSSTAASGQAATSAISVATSYPITCAGAAGTTTTSVTVSIASAAPPPSTAPSPPTGNQPPPASAAPAKSGGGALGWPALLLLAALVSFVTNRRRRCK